MAKAPNLSCLRMSVLSAAAAWTWWPLRWAKLDMSSPSHTAWALGPSEPPTSVSDGGLWGGAPVDRTLTPVRQDTEQSGSSKRVPSLTSQARSATPRAHEVGEYQRDRGDPEKPRPTLTGQVRGNAMPRSPTPAAHDAKRGGESRETKAARGAGGINLVRAIGDATREPSPSPTTESSSDTKPRPTSGSGPGRRYSSTPAAQDSGNSSLPPSQATRDTLPGDLIRYSATPVGAGGGSTSRGGDRKGELLLGGQIRQQSADGPCPSSPDTSSTNGNSPSSISAAWETQYMGYPDGWLQLGTEQESWLSATLSSRRSSRRSQQA